MITNEHVVAMMKAAISETEDIPLFVSKRLPPLFQMHLHQSVFLVTWHGDNGWNREDDNLPFVTRFATRMK